MHQTPGPPGRTASNIPSAGLPWPLVLGLLLVISAPTLLLTYLPQTDMPQHLAVTAILRDLGDPAASYGKYYTPALGRTMYLLPYGLSLLLSAAMPLELAHQCVVFLSVILFPLALLRLLRALGKPPQWVLLCCPLIYNSAFFWGFTSFSLSVSLALFAIAVLVEDRRGTREDLQLAALGGALAFSHLYGLALLLGYALLALLLGPRRSLRHQLLPLAPALIGAAVWPWPSAGEGLGHGVPWPSPQARLLGFPQEVFGAYLDHSELVLISLFLFGIFAMCAGGRPQGSRWRWRSLSWQERALTMLAAVNLLLYMVLPIHTATAKFIHFRHGLLFMMLLPALLPAGPAADPRTRRARGAVLLVVAVASAALAWSHLLRFQQEASSFDEVCRAVPRAPRVLSMIIDPNGGVMGTHPYLHFAAYIQARKGGYISSSFARFWNIPVQRRPGAGIPPTPNMFEWQPRRYSYKRFGYFYDHVLVRSSTGVRFQRTDKFPFELVLDRPPWQLYRKRNH